MGYKLLDLADVLRPVGQVAEYTVRSFDGTLIPWFKAGRSQNSDYDSVNHIMVHHTASKTSIDNDISYCAFNSTIRPITNLMIDRAGHIHVLAGGPTNTNGKGSSLTWTNIVRDNEMNKHAISIEVCNNGVGEPYPIAQQDALVKVCARLSTHYKIPVHYIRGHFEWTDRKIDPSGPSKWSAAGKWNMGAFRSSVAKEISQPIIGKKKMTYFDDPLRIFDSRTWGSTFKAGVHDMPLRDFGAIPDSAEALTLTITAVPVGKPGFVTLWSGANNEVPVGSCLNYSGVPIANTTVVKLSGKAFKLFVSADTHLIFDVNGWQ